MTSDLCSEDVVVRITTPHTPQIITTARAMNIVRAQQAGAAGTAGAGAAGARVAASSAAVELGRRLLLAARAGDTAAVLDLMAKGAPFTTDWLGTSPLHLAAGAAHADTCAVLLRAGVSRDARTKVERTPLHLAAAAGHARVARLLLLAGAAVDVRDMLRMTPLHWAAVRGHAGVAAALLAAGADPHALSKFHKTPLSLAAELGRAELRALMEDALKEREAARSVTALVSEHMDETSTTEPQIQTFDAVQRIQDLKPTKQKQSERKIKTEANTASACSEPPSAAAQLLRKHGITLLPTDDGSTVLNALQSGRTVVLSDAGKLMLKESSETSPPTPHKVGPSKMASVATPQQAVPSQAAPSQAAPSQAVPSQAAPGGKGVLLTATPVSSPPKPGVKIFTLNNKLLALSKDHKIPVKKIINPQDMQVKFIQLPPDAKIISPSKFVPMKAKNRLRTSTPSPSSATQRPAVKIIMNKTNFNKLIATATRTTEQKPPEVTVAQSLPTIETESAAETADNPAVLRAQLVAAQRALAAVRRDLSVTRAKLAQYERIHEL